MLRSKLLANEITLQEYYMSKLKINSDQYSEHFNNYNHLQTDYLDKIKSSPAYFLWNKRFNFTELLLILLNVVYQFYFLLTRQKKIPVTNAD